MSGLDIDLLTAAAVDVQALITGAGEAWISKNNAAAEVVLCEEILKFEAVSDTKIRDSLLSLQ